MKYVLGLLLALVSLGVSAQVPQRFELVYRFTLNGQFLGNVTDRFQRREGRQYQLTSVAKPEGHLALLLPTLTLTSQGTYKPQQLIPKFYRQVRSNAPAKAAQAEFDWSKGLLMHHYKGRTAETPLPSGTQDALSQLYVFAMMQALPDKLDMPVTNGRKLMTYRYEKRPGPRIETPLGSFDTVEYRRIAEAGENLISVWVAPALHHLPVRIRVKEDTGVFEQELIKLDYQAT